jgi:phosphomannomutase
MIYIFDIDGTLTPSRNVIDPKFKTFFEYFIKKNRVWLISGSDKDKTIEQIGHNIWGSVERAYQCSGNQLYEQGKLTSENKWECPDYLIELLEKFLDRSDYSHRYGNHIEKRVGMVNFSVVGRNCNQYQRDQYFIWDTRKKEREAFAWEIRNRYPWLDAVVGGEISIDIFPKGDDKGQIVTDIDGEFTFFGDKLQPGGNDYAMVSASLEQKRKDATFHEVESWEDTFNLLSSKYN